MIVDADCPYRSSQQCQEAEDYTDDNDTMERRLKTLSHGLAEAIPSTKRQAVQFIHQSVKDFFVENGLSALGGNAELAGTEVDLVGIAQYRLSRSCIRYLAMEEIDRSTIRIPDDLMSEFPLLHYTTTSWVSHVKESEERKISQDDLLDYFSWPSDALTKLWARIYDEIASDSGDAPGKGSSMLHVAARYQLLSPLRKILQNTGLVNVDLNVRDSVGETPLSQAARDGHEAVVRLLLATGKVDIDAKDKSGRTPLSRAARYRHKAVVQQLRNHGAAW